MDLSVVRDVHMTINGVHRFVYFVPETAEEYGPLGLSGQPAYFASRAAPLGTVPPQVILATFYNFSPKAVYGNLTAVQQAWSANPPAAIQEARFRVVGRAMARVGVDLSPELIGEARSLIDPVVAGLELAGRPLAAANTAIAVPEDRLVALWQQVTVLREWRGDAHIAVLVANEVGPCECMVLQVGTGRFPLGITRATRQWSEQEWSGAIERLAARGWVDADGAMTDAGLAERERLEAETDRLCAPVWASVGDQGAARFAALIAPIHEAMAAAGTYAALS